MIQSTAWMDEEEGVGRPLSKAGADGIGKGLEVTEVCPRDRERSAIEVDAEAKFAVDVEGEVLDVHEGCYEGSGCIVHAWKAVGPVDS